MSTVDCSWFFIVSGKAVTKRWGNLRDAFSKSKRKLKECKKSGAGAPKIKKYVYAEQMQFLNKLYQSREVAESLEDNSVMNVDEDADDEQSQQSVVQESMEGEGNIRENNTGHRKRRRPDEVEMKILKALEEPTPNAHMSFFQGLLPHLNKFDDGEVLEFQMDVLQVISRINDKKKTGQLPPPQTYPYYYQCPRPQRQSSSFPYSQQSYANQFNSNSTLTQNQQFHSLENRNYYNTNNQQACPSRSQPPEPQREHTTAQCYQQFGQSLTPLAATSPGDYSVESPSPCASVSTDNTYDFS